MIIGLAGAHRTGKTTLAKIIAEELEIDFVSSSFGEAAKRHGYDAVADMTLTERIGMQIKVLHEHQNFLMANRKVVITDRTPIDMLAYTLAEVGMQSHTQVEASVLQAVEAYKQLCLALTSKFYKTVFVLGPLDHYAEEPGKPAFNTAFQSHIQLLIDGAACNLEGVQLAFIETTDLAERREIVHDVVVETMNDMDLERRTAAHIH